MLTTYSLIVVMIILQVNIVELDGEPTSGMTTLSIDTPNMPASLVRFQSTPANIVGTRNQ